MVVAVGTPVFAMQDNGHVEVAVDLPENAALSLPLGPELEDFVYEMLRQEQVDSVLS